jgi:cellulase/cellobiase CelA1
MAWKFIRFAHWQVWVTAAATLISLTAAASPAAAGTRVACTYTVTNSWAGGFTANVDITNNGPAINGWTLQWTFPAPTSLGGVWSAVITEQGNRATATNMSWNGTIPSGRSTSIGWSASAVATAVPTDLTINGQPC